MIELLEEELRSFSRQSSKGNQLKGCKDGKWYKADYAGYEGLAEYVISALLKFSSLEEDEFVRYELTDIKYKDSVLMGVESSDFLHDDWQIVTLERLFKTSYGRGLNSMIYSIEDHTERVKSMVNQVIRITGIEDFGQYIQKMFAIDAFFLNEDRHTHNIAVLMNGKGEYKKCPIFDNGAGLLSDTTLDYSLGKDPIALMGTVKAKSVCQSFEEQLEIAERLYGNNIKFSFTKKDVEKILKAADKYGSEVIDRVRDVIYEQMRRYLYLF